MKELTYLPFKSETGSQKSELKIKNKSKKIKGKSKVGRQKKKVQSSWFQVPGLRIRELIILNAKFKFYIRTFKGTPAWRPDEFCNSYQTLIPNVVLNSAG